MQENCQNFFELVTILKRIKELVFKEKRSNLDVHSLKNVQVHNQMSLSHIPVPDRARLRVKKKQMNASWLSQKDLQDTALHTHQCCANQKKLSIISFEAHLSARRVKSWRQKEYLLASRNLQKMRREQESRNQASSKNYHITVVDEKKEEREKEVMQESAQWVDFIKQKEERHFLITRITRFLTD
jgi:hypothetical protein